MSEKEFSLASVMKSIGLPMISEGYIIFYFDNEWKWHNGMFMAPGSESPSDIELTYGLLESYANKGVTKDNISHIIRIFDFYGTPDQITKVCNGYETFESFQKDYQTKIIVTNAVLFKEYMKDHD